MSNELKAAVGKVQITPEEEVRLRGFNHSKYIAHPPSDILDPLFARILLLDDGHQCFLFVSVDSCIINEETDKAPNANSEPGKNHELIATFPSGTRKNWAKAAGTDENFAVIFATHTHSASSHYSEKYTKRIEAKIGELMQSLVPVKLSIGKGKSAISAYRRPDLLPNYDVPIDQTLHAILFETEDGKLLGGLINYAVHPTILHPPALANRVSAECVGWAMNELEDELGGGFVALFAQGFSGDVCPILPGCGAEKDADLYGNVKEAGHQLYLDASQTLLSRQPFQVDPCLMKQKQVSLPTRPGFSRDTVELTWSGMALGDVVILFTSGEIFNGYVDKIKAISPFSVTILVSLANGYSGYIPTQEAFRDGLGGYEMRVTPFEESVDALFMDSAAELLQDLYSGRL